MCLRDKIISFCLWIVWWLMILLQHSMEVLQNEIFPWFLRRLPAGLKKTRGNEFCGLVLIQSRSQFDIKNWLSINVLKLYGVLCHKTIPLKNHIQFYYRLKSQMSQFSCKIATVYLIVQLPLQFPDKWKEMETIFSQRANLVLCATILYIYRQLESWEIKQKKLYWKN